MGSNVAEPALEAELSRPLSPEQATSRPVLRPWTRGRLTAFVKLHSLAWELGCAALTVVYVVLAFQQDQGTYGVVSIAVLAIAGISLRRVMGFTVMSFFVGLVVFGLALLFLA